MSIPKLRITKKPRDSPIPDIPISFPPLKNLHLELLEIKDKLKLGLPLIPLSKPKLHTYTTLITKESDKKSLTTKESKESDKKSLAPKESKVSKDNSSSEELEKSEEIKKKNRDINKKNTKEKDDALPLVDARKAMRHPNGEDIKKKDGDNKKKDESKKKVEDNKKKNIKKEEKLEDDDIILELGEESEEEKSVSVSLDEKESGSLANSEEEEEEKIKEDEEDDPYAGLSPEERAAKEKEEYIWRFRILKKQYGKTATIPIPEWNEHSDLHMMKTSYERTIRELYLDDAVETYRTYLLGGWIVMEYVCVQLIGVDIRGFTLQQIKMMYKYDRMLIELGEKSYTRWGMNLPVEVRLIGMILFQAAIFYLGKIIADNYGDSVAELFKGFTGQPPAGPSSEKATERTQPETKDPSKKMKGPHITPEDIRKRHKPIETQ
jgi:hypothetical protein